jgi:hypothetical protein
MWQLELGPKYTAHSLLIPNMKNVNVAKKNVGGVKNKPINL